MKNIGYNYQNADISNRRLVSDESVQEVPTKYNTSAPPYQSQSVAHNNFVD